MQKSIPRVKPEFVSQRIANGKQVHLLDVRSAREFNDGHARGAISLPAEQLDAVEVNKRLGPDAGQVEPLYLICTAGFRAQQVAEKLRAEGLSKLLVVEGGTQAWEQRRLPMRKPGIATWHFPVTPQAQAELFTGVLIMLFAIKGLLLHPLFMGVAALAGFSLAVSAGSERYSLARVFARMPWNRASNS